MNENDIADWKEAFSSLPDKQFFNTVRLYLGEIKTPYNKQRLSEQLAAFIRREENLSSMLTLLDSFDIKVLTAISLIPNATQESLADFFHGESTVTEIYAEIINLTERLLIYRPRFSRTTRPKLFLLMMSLPFRLTCLPLSLPISKSAAFPASLTA